MGQMKSQLPPVLQIPDFRLLFLTRLLAAMALQAQAVIVGWQIYRLHPDPLLLGLIGLTEAIPAISCSFVSGHLVDNHLPVWIFRLALFTLVLNTVLISVGGADFFGLAAHTRIVILFCGIFISGAARSFTSPAIFSLIPQVVPRNLISASAGWMSSTYQFASIAGPAIGGLVYGAYGSTAAFCFPPLLMLAGFVASQFFTESTSRLRSQSVREPFLQSIRAGIAFTLNQKVLLSALTLDMFSVLFGGAVAVLPIFADQVLKSGSFGLGLLRSAPAAGSGLVALYLAIEPMRVISGRVLLVAVAGFGAATIGFAFSPTFAFALFFLALTGVFDGVSMVIRSTILQLLTPENMRGRVSALNSIFVTSSNEIGAFESGLAARVLGLIPSLVFGGGMTLLIVGLIGGLSPGLRRTRIDGAVSS